jgi:hypothetical protein
MDALRQHGHARTRGIWADHDLHRSIERGLNEEYKRVLRSYFCSRAGMRCAFSRSFGMKHVYGSMDSNIIYKREIASPLATVNSGLVPHF